jgi:hypothetical protein
MSADEDENLGAQEGGAVEADVAADFEDEDGITELAGGGDAGAVDGD